MKKELSINLEKIEQLYVVERKTRKEIADYFGVKPYVIDNIIHIHNLHKSSAEDLVSIYEKKLPKELLQKLYVKDKLSYSEIVKQYKIPGDYLDKLLAKYDLGKRSIVRRLKKEYTKEQLEDLYFTQNMTIDEISEALGTNYLNIRKLFKQLGIRNKSKELIQENIKKTLVQKYGTTSVNNIPGVSEKRKQTCLKKYGAECVLISPHSYNAFKNDSKPNQAFAKLLDDAGIEYEREFPIGNRSFDFKVGDTLIEIDPYGTHNSTWGIMGGEGKSPTYHIEKTQLAVENGYQCIHVWDWDNKDKVVQLLLPKTNRIFARKCEIKEIIQHEANIFLKQYHLQNGAKLQTACFGLFYKGELVELMTFGKPRFNKHFQWELIRLCTKTGHVVVGGSERLFKHFVEKYNPESIISYCDMSKFKGNVYTNLGFKLMSKNNPSRHWYNPETGNSLTDNGVRILGFDKLVGRSVGQVFGKGTSNDELLRQFGWVEIWDAGQAVFTWPRKD